jgi:hypothetical protein
VWNAVWRAVAREGESVVNSGTRYLADTTHDLSYKKYGHCRAGWCRYWRDDQLSGKSR